MTLVSHRHRTPTALIAVLALLASAFVALTVTGPAAAQSECGKQVLEDWFDNGRVDKLYPPHCYEDAIDAIPKDLGPYVDAEEVISRALQSALSGKLAPGGCDPTPDGSEDDCRIPGSPSTGGSGGSGNGQGGPGGSGGGNPEAAPEVDPSGASSVPVPLIVLGGMSVALLAAGGLGYLSRRRVSAESGEPGDDLTL